MDDNRQAVLLGPAEGLDVGRLDNLFVHSGRHKGAALIAHVLVIPDTVRVAFLLKQDFLELDSQVRVSFGHIPHPVRVQGHAHQHIFVAAHRMHALKDVDAAPHKEPSGVCGGFFCVAVGLEVDAAGIRLQQEGFDFLPVLPLFHREIHMLRGGVVEFVPPEDSAVSVQKCNGILILSHNFLLEIQVRYHVKGPAFGHIKTEMVVEGFPVGNMPFGPPGVIGVAPEMLINSNAVHRLVPENPQHPFFSCHKNPLLSEKLCGISIA